MSVLNDKRIAFIGAGLMGGVLIERLLDTGFPRTHILAVEPRAERRAYLAHEWHIAVSDGAHRVPEFADAIVLAVPTKAVREVLRDIAPQLRAEHIVISVAAAVPLAALEQIAGEGIGVARVMPNSPSRVGQGMNPVALGRFVTPEAREWVMRLLACWGQTIEVPDALMNLCVGLSGAAPTYIFPIIDALTEAGVAGGLSLTDARHIAAQVVLGSAVMVLETGETPTGLKALTPLQPLREADAKALFRQAVESARAQMDALQAKLSEG
jgi:pyrroline-5-carboxylate reductase